MTDGWQTKVKETFVELQKFKSADESYITYVEQREPAKGATLVLADALIENLDSFPLVYIPNARSPNFRYNDKTPTVLLSDPTDPESARLFVCFHEDDVVNCGHWTKLVIGRIFELHRQYKTEGELSQFIKLLRGCIHILRSLEIHRVAEEKEQERRDRERRDHESRKQKPLFKMSSLPLALQPKLPKLDDMNVAGWLTEVKEIFSPYIESDSDILQSLGPLLPDYMREKHGEWKTKSWDEYLQAMTEAFQVEVGWSAIQDAMLMQTIKVGESPRSFLLRVDAMANKIKPKMPENDRCRIFLQLLPTNLAEKMVDKVNNGVKSFIESVEAVISAGKLLSGHKASAWGLPVQNSNSEPVKARDTGDKICALLEQLAVGETTPQASNLEKAADKLVQFVDRQNARVGTQDTEQIAESVMKLMETRFPSQFAGRGVGRGRGRGRGGHYGRGGYAPQGGYVPQGGYAPRGGYGAPYQTYGPRMPRGGYVQRPYYQVQQRQYQPAPFMPQQRAILPPPQAAPQAPQPQGPQHEIRVCYRCGVAGHLAYQCQNF